MQLTLKVVLNQRPNEVEFYNTILHSTHDILVRDVDNEDAQMEVDKEDLEEAETAASFAEKIGVFDKAPAAESTPPADKAPPQALEPSIPQASWDKLVADMAEVKAKKLEINKKFDLVLQFEKKVDLLLQILNKKEEKNEEQGGSSALNEFLNPPSVECTPLMCKILWGKFYYSQVHESLYRSG